MSADDRTEVMMCKIDEIRRFDPSSNLCIGPNIVMEANEWTNERIRLKPTPYIQQLCTCIRVYGHLKHNSSPETARIR